MSSVDELRAELKRLGYLTQGIERWFALDPLSSRTFWSELLLLAAKSAALLCVFIAAPYLAVMLLRNDPAGVAEGAVLAAIYIASSFAVVFLALLVSALLFKLRPQLGVRSPRVVTAIGILLSAAVTSLLAVWWLGFGSLPRGLELVAGAALAVIAFALASRVFFAALLSFTIHETGTIPTVRRRSAALPITAGAVTVLAVLLVPIHLRGTEPRIAPPSQVPVRPTAARIALIGVDGLTHEIFATRGDLQSLLPSSQAADSLPHASSPEIWATVGTGTPPELHKVRSIEGVRLLGGRRILQSVSRCDLPLRTIATAIGLASREPLPPTARERGYVWEIVGGRGVQALAVNWWTAPAEGGGALTSIPQSEIFARAGAGPPAERAVAIDISAGQALRGADLQLVSAYLPALDILLNRLRLDSASRLTGSVAVLENLSRITADLRRAGYSVILVGIPGEGQEGRAVIATDLPPSASDVSLLDVAPTVLDLLGFPASEEMPGRSFYDSPAGRIASYGQPGEQAAGTELTQEYYESLRALGYIQ
jgi:hypothetical protein